MALPPLDPQQRKNLLLGGLLVALGTFGAWTYLHEPRAAEVAALETRLASLEQTNSTARARTRGQDNPEEALELYRRQLEVVEGLIPSGEELPDLLDAISAEAQQTGVEISLIQPVGATEESYYTRRVYDMAVLGRYHEIGEFLTRVASLPRIVTPLNLQISPAAPAAGGARGRAPQGAPEDGPPELEARFSIETYVIPTAPLDDATAD